MTERCYSNGRSNAWEFYESQIFCPTCLFTVEDVLLPFALEWAAEVASTDGTPARIFGGSVSGPDRFQMAGTRHYADTWLEDWFWLLFIRGGGPVMLGLNQVCDIRLLNQGFSTQQDFRLISVQVFAVACIAWLIVDCMQQSSAF